MIGKLMDNLEETGELNNTIVRITSDHGDLLGPQGAYKKQQPYDESIRVPILYQLPENMDIPSGKRDALIDSADIMSTLLELCGIPFRIPWKVPDTDCIWRETKKYGSVDYLCTACLLYTSPS